MKTVIIVDTDAVMRETLAGLIKSQGSLINVLSAESGRAALELINRQPIDVVVTGLQLPEIDGFQLVTFLATKHPQIRVIVMTHNASPMYRAQLKQLPSAVHFHQAIDITLLTQRLFTELNIDYGGQVRGLSLSSFLQMIELEGRSCALHISNKGNSGILWMREGSLIDAQSDSQQGKEAAIRILTWENVSIDIDYSPVERPRQINSALMSLLLESGRISDERRSHGHNQRSHDRYEILVAVDYNISEWTYQCFLRDISLSGAYIETEQSVSIGQRILLTLSSPASDRTHAIQGQVVRRDKKGIGVHFDALSLQQKQTIEALAGRNSFSFKESEPAAVQ